MGDTLPRREPTLGEFIADRARRASDARLAGNAMSGLVLAAVVAILEPPGWAALLCIGMMFSAYGFWAIADRELAERGTDGWVVTSLRTLRWLAALAGALACLGLAATVLAITLGTVIS